MSSHTVLSLYYYDACPFCRMVLRELNQLNISFEKRNIMESQKHYKNLITGGGKQTVPCLLIDEHGKNQQWMYESQDIIHYLRTKI